MRRFALALTGVVSFLLTAAVNPAFAQSPFPNPIQPPATQPPVSPYINLLRPGNSPALNYYGLVRPQQEFRNSYQRLQQDVTAEQQQPAFGPVDVSGLPPTGHSTQFNTQGRYFMTLGAHGSTNTGKPVGATPLRPPIVSPPQTPGIPSASSHL